RNSERALSKSPPQAPSTTIRAKRASLGTSKRMPQNLARSLTTCLNVSKSCGFAGSSLHQFTSSDRTLIVGNMPFVQGRKSRSVSYHALCSSRNGGVLSRAATSSQDRIQSDRSNPSGSEAGYLLRETRRGAVKCCDSSNSRRNPGAGTRKSHLGKLVT